MAKSKIEKSLTDQIIDDMLSRLKKREEFDPAIIDRIAKLAESGQLSKAKLVAGALWSSERVENEDSVA